MKKLSSTRKIRPATILRVYRKGYGYSRIEIFDNNDQYLAALCNSDLIESVNYGDVLESYLWIEDDASYDFHLLVIGKITIGNKFLFFSHTEDIKRTRGRKCIGLKSDFPIKFIVFDTGNDHKTISTENIDSLEGSLIWLEDREAVIKSVKPIMGHHLLKSNVKLGYHTIEFVGFVAPLNEEKNIYNITFSGMSDKDRNKILDFIFDSYRE